MHNKVKKTKDDNTELHSYNDEPAIIKSNGDKYWYCHGKRHREYGPAIIKSNGDKYWYCHGKIHRENDPAIIKSNGNKYWFRHGRLHRENGPAAEYHDGDKHWYAYGEECTFKEWLKLVSLTDEQKTELLLSHV